MNNASCAAVPERCEIKNQDKWNVEALYPSPQVWTDELSHFVTAQEPPFFPKLATFKGTLNQIEKLLGALELVLATERQLDMVANRA